MGKKMEDAGAKKECPSCGLGVALEANICEFCGWDFEEEDEWILQIERLERDLMLEKQKFEPGTVDQRIESTLHTPAFERIEMIKNSQNSESSIPDRQVSQQSPAMHATAKPAAQAPATGPKVRQVRAPAPAPMPSEPEQKVRRVRSVKASPEAAAATPIARAVPNESRKTRTVRKVKQ